MSITTVAPATVSGIVATSASDAPFTVTAEIATDALGVAYLLVVVDGERYGFKIDPRRMRLREQTVEGEATRLLQRHAGYAPTGEWTESRPGHMTACVAEITGRCVTCAHGCRCEIGDLGCGHFGCPAACPEAANTCDGAHIHLAARRPKRVARRRARR